MPCCGPDLTWVCAMCNRDSCGRHDPSPGEARGICEDCIPYDYDQENTL